MGKLIIANGLYKKLIVAQIDDSSVDQLRNWSQSLTSLLFTYQVKILLLMSDEDS